MSLVTLDGVSIAYGHLPLLDRVGLRVAADERIAVIGRNGTGKSTLLRIVEKSLAPDSGSVWHQRGLRVARLDQDIPLSTARRVFDVVHDGLAPAASHTGSADSHPADASSTARPHDGTPADDEPWIREQQVDVILSRLGLDGDTRVDTLSGGWRRRVLLARTLVSAPDLLLLDEPTNHLDIEAIRWLEDALAAYRGAVMFVTHDREFLQRLATRLVELDRGQLTSWPGDYATYLRRRDEALQEETASDAKFDKKLAEEEVWIRRGIKARRTRDEGRVRALLAMRAERAARRSAPGQVRLRLKADDPSGRVVFECEAIEKHFDGVPVLRSFSTRIMRGDRIGLIGPNGSGKTTLLRLLLGELATDTGQVARGANVQIAYYDQQREQLDPDRSVVDTVGDGNDQIVIRGQTRHVMGYLQDFLFSPERARSPVRALSGGERNRLLLARLLTRPANVLVLDEPTNDLDLETLELLEEQLLEWQGTLLLVSHDRRFLDNVVTSTIAFEGDGRWQEYVGGYQDWLRQRPPEARERVRPAVAVGDRPRAGLRSSAPKTRRSFNEQRELAALPSQIAALEAEQQALQARIAAPAFYKEGADAIRTAMRDLEALNDRIQVAYERWIEFESMSS